MNDNAHPTAGSEPYFDDFVAELTRAAYDVALPHVAAGTWLDLEFDLWRALADTVNHWCRKPLTAVNRVNDVLIRSHVCNWE